MKSTGLVAILLVMAVAPWRISFAQATPDHPKPSTAYIDRVNRALAAQDDLWGEELLHAPQGPTLAGSLSFLHPLWHQSRWYSTSEVYYLPFGMEDDLAGGRDFALHYADGSEIVTRRAELPPAAMPASAPPSAGQRITFFVGPQGKERYGRSLFRLTTPQLSDGYLPILITRYRDASGNRYREESFALRVPKTHRLLSFIHFTVEAGPTSAKLRVHFSRVDRQAKKLENVLGLTVRGGRVLGPNGQVYLLFTSGANLSGSDLAYSVPKGQRAEVWLVRLNNPGAISLAADASTYAAARRQVAAYWNAKLTAAARFVVPEPYAMDAEKNLLIQNLLMNVRYSIGNPYETAFSSESHFSIQALGDFGFLPEYRTGLEALLGYGHPAQYEMGERLLHGADYYFLTRDGSFLRAHEALYRSYVAALAEQMARNHGLLDRVPTGTDIAGSSLHFNMHQQAVAWRGLRDMAEAWRLSGDAADSLRAAGEAAELGGALHKAMVASSTWLPDGSLFVPVHLLEPAKVPPFDPITTTKEGAYWLLVATDGFAAGILNQHEDRGVLRYLYDHGANLLGLIRFNYTGEPVGGCNSGGLPGYAVPGVDNAYLPSYLEFLAASDQADRLVLTFYGKLAQGMTRNTFIAGEGDSVGVCQAAPMAYGTSNAYYRTMYLPPNSTNNAAYLLGLRTMLVRERSDAAGRPTGLDLAFATPRPWLADGKHIEVFDVPTYFGPLNYRLTSHLAQGEVTADIAIPARDPIESLRLRLRVPSHRALRSVRVDGRPYAKFTSLGDIDLTGLHGRVHVTARFTAAR